jgi:hypothetical protein
MLVRTDIVVPELARRSAHSSSARAWLISSSSNWSSTAFADTSAADSIGSYAERLTAPGSSPGAQGQRQAFGARAW